MEKKPVGRPRAHTTEAEKEFEKIEKQFLEKEENLKQLASEDFTKAPLKEEDPQTKLAQKDIEKMPEHWLKPFRQIQSREKFNERYRAKYDFAKEYVEFIAENKEVKGETIEIWTKPFAGVPCMLWNVPTNKPVWGPRYLAEQIKSRTYRRLMMNERKLVSDDGRSQLYGALVVEANISRLDAIPVTQNKSIFMGRY